MAEGRWMQMLSSYSVMMYSVQWIERWTVVREVEGLVPGGMLIEKGFML